MDAKAIPSAICTKIKYLGLFILYISLYDYELFFTSFGSLYAFSGLPSYDFATIDFGLDNISPAYEFPSFLPSFFFFLWRFPHSSFVHDDCEFFFVFKMMTMDRGYLYFFFVVSLSGCGWSGMEGT